MQRKLYLTCAVFALAAVHAVQAQTTKVAKINGAWSNASTWSPIGVPGPGDDVVIASNTTVTLASTTADLGFVHIKGTLTNASRTANLELRANRIEIYSAGTLQLGTQATTYLGNARIVLLANASEASYELASLIAQPNSTLDLHGQDRGTPWTVLGESTPAVPESTTVSPGSATLFTPVSWGAGDSVALVSNDYYRPYSTFPDARVAEFVNLNSVTANGYQINFSGSLAQQHFAGIDRGVTMRAEVALMNRNIVVTGSGQTPFGHVMFMGTSANSSAASGPTVRLSWARFENLGKYGIRGRYPLHFHLNGNARTSGRNFIRNCVVAHSSNRSFVIHGTNQVDLTGNIAYDVVGHSYYFEDGTETGNVLEWNLGFGTRPGPTISYEGVFKNSNQQLPDRIRNNTPATFYVTNQDNQIRFNYSGSTAGFGFWYHIPQWLYPIAGDPDPDSRIAHWDNQVAPGSGAAIFSGNVAHTSFRDGFFCNDRVAAGWGSAGGVPMPQVPVALFSNFTAYKNSRSGIWHRQRGIALWDHAALADNRIACYFASEGIQEYSFRGLPTFTQQPPIQVASDPNSGIPGAQAHSFIALVSSTVLGDSVHAGQVSSDNAEEALLGRSLPYIPNPNVVAPTLEGFQVYDGLTAIVNTSFDSFPAPPAGSSRGVGAITPFLTDGGGRPGNQWQVDTRIWCESLSFGPSIASAERVWLRTPPSMTQGWPGSFANGELSFSIYDKDGTLTGSAGTYVHSLSPLMETTGDLPFGTGARRTTNVADEFGNLIIMHEESETPQPASTVMNSGSPNQFTFDREISYINLASTTRANGNTPVYNVLRVLRRASQSPALYSRAYPISVLAGDTYLVGWGTAPSNATPAEPWSGGPPTRLRLRWRNSSPGNWVIVRMPFNTLEADDSIIRAVGSTQNQTTLTLSTQAYASWAAAPGNTYHYDANNGLLSIYMQMGTRTGGHVNNCNGEAVDVFINTQ